MRDPNCLHDFYEYSAEAPDIIKIGELPPFDIKDFDLNDEKEFSKYLFTIEKLVRNSTEYKTWMKYLRDYVDMNKCSYFSNINNIDTTKVRIELHHEPLSLYDIVVTVYNKRVHFRESLEMEMVAKEVMYHHYVMDIGIIPLCETVHELVHNNYLFVPSTHVFGNFRKFVNDYKDFMPPEVLMNLDSIDEYTKAYQEDDYKDLLQTKYLYIDHTGAYKLPKLEDVSKLVKGHLRESMEKNAQNDQNTPTVFGN